MNLEDKKSMTSKRIEHFLAIDDFSPSCSKAAKIEAGLLVKPSALGFHSL